MTKIFCVSNQKGGVGKTTTAAILAQAAAYKGKKVLAIDLDPQGDLSFALGIDDVPGNSYDLLTGGMDPADTVTRSPQGLDVIPGSVALATLKTAKNSARRLQDALQPLRGRYDMIFIDTPTKADELQYNALQAATGLIIPTHADIYNLKSLIRTINTAAAIRNTNPKLKVAGYILTEFDARSNIKKKLQELIEKQAAAIGKVRCLGAVRKSVVVEEAAAFQTSLFEYAPKSKPAIDCLAILEQL